jgi:transposase
LGRIISDETKEIETEIEVADAIFNIALNRLTNPTSKMKLENEWQDGYYDLTHYQLHQYYRAMDYLIEKKDQVEKSLFAKTTDLFNLSVDLVFFDTTTIVYYGDSDKHEELLKRGFSKDRRGDLKQIVIGVVMSKEGYPLAHEVFPGNTNDQTCFKAIIDKVAKKFSIRKVILVGDRGMMNNNNIEKLNKYNYQYILGYRMRTLSKETRAKILSTAKMKKVTDTFHWKKVEHEGTKLFVCYNPERAEIDARRREETLELLYENLKSAEAVKALVTNKDYRRFVKIEGKKPVIDKEKIEQDKLYDGMYVITSNTNLTGPEVIERYKGLWQVEAAFRSLKSEIEVGPMHHRTDNRIRAHVMICFFALMMKIILEKKLKETYKEVSMSTVMSDLKRWQVVTIKLNNNAVISRTDYRPGALQAIKALKMKVPPQILNVEASSTTLVV